MARLLELIISVFAFFLSLSSALPLTCSNGPCRITRADLSPAQVLAELGPQLCTTASIFGPNNPEWSKANARYQTYKRPNFTVAVQVGCESDVSTIIKYANHNGMEFYTVNRGHGWSISQGNFHGLMIDMQKLTGVAISVDGQSALFQGGTYGEQMIPELWDHGYETPTGACGCVGILGPGLGGGMGRLQGMHGLIADNFLQLSVVLGDGTPITVSEDSHPDLFWAMKGAGHNFGVVTSFASKIYPRSAETWYYKNYIFPSEELEEVFVRVNKLVANQPPELGIHYGEYTFNPSVSKTQATLSWTFGYAGPKEAIQPYLAPLDNLKTINVTEGNVPYPQLPRAQGTGANDGLCDSQLDRITATAGLQSYNITTQRKIYDFLSETVAAHPELIQSFILLEGYSNQAVKSVNPALSAYPFRDRALRTLAAISYESNPAMDAIASDTAAHIQELWNEGEPDWKTSTYVNYAFGTEPLEAMYGYEPWRLERLKALKSQYDPDNKFRFYNPIIR